MDTSDPHKPRERDELVSSAVDQADSAKRAKTWMVRFGWIVCIFGLVITLAGVSQLARGWDAPGRVMHSIGLLILLGGFATALVGYRIPWIASIFRSSRTTISRQASIQSGTWSQVRLLVVLLATALMFWLGSLVFVMLAPSVVTGLYITTMTFVFTAAALVVIASGTRPQRAFSIGAVIPLILTVCYLWIFLISGTRPFGRGYRPDNLWETFTGQLELLYEMVVQMGIGTRLPVLVAWLGSLLIGCAALGVRVVLYHVNGEGRKSEEPQTD